MVIICILYIDNILLERLVKYTSIVFKYNHRNGFVTCDFTT
ncbi:hypothetical protein DDB_G0284417 [Dictyostelium discoideum AX4]|nr:hypothetical protein DDB_G0284417 [Dictyostelium discoideum AX4]EAL65257.1 hypothetical protein DDB_G0284417 [Dictyostelium discoideum AX4]|eukprot:XP_638618.1 hypothetical protein DDB_G0284417 [Dictyostelium discoideum AX4]